jgi:hypothetical protein
MKLKPVSPRVFDEGPGAGERANCSPPHHGERHIFGSGASMHVRQSIEAAACYACASELSFADARSTSRCGYLAVQLDRVGHDDDTS